MGNQDIDRIKANELKWGKDIEHFRVQPEGMEQFIAEVQEQIEAYKGDASEALVDKQEDGKDFETIMSGSISPEETQEAQLKQLLKKVEAICDALGQENPEKLNISRARLQATVRKDFD